MGERLLDIILRMKSVRPSMPSAIPGLAFVSPFDLVLMAVVSALCGTGVIMVLNEEARRVDNQDYSIALALGFIALLIVYRLSQGALISKSAEAIEDALHERRARVIGKVLQLDLQDTQALTRARLVDGMARHYELASQTIVPLLSGFQSVVLLGFMVCYLFWQSILAGCLTLLFAGLITQGYLGRAAEMQKVMTSAALADAALLASAEEIAGGFKELRLSKAKQDAIHAEVVELSSKLACYRARCASIIGELITTGTAASYMLGAAVVFILPILSSGHGTELSRIVTTVLFLLGPLGGIVGAAQQFATARFALQGIEQFERAIDQRLLACVAPTHAAIDLKQLQIENVCFVHNGQEAGKEFGVRGIALDLKPGELVFITGGNGSGKTTTLRVLTGLYPAQSGSIRVNSKLISPDRLDDYRHLFSAVFADFHTFRKPYGLDEAGLSLLPGLLCELEIASKLPEDLTQGFDPTALSTGQRKRLALALAIAERRAILVLDEWAADQDPAYRDYFYRTILPNLKASGTAVIAVTHDERYFNLADRRYHMEDGELRMVSQT